MAAMGDMIHIKLLYTAHDNMVMQATMLCIMTQYSYKIDNKVLTLME